MGETVVKMSELTHFFEKQKYASEMADKYKYLLYGGSAGPGKSYWLRWYPVIRLLKWFNRTKQKGIRGSLFCEDYPSLRDRHISKMAYEYPRWLGEIKESKEHGLGFHIRPEFGSGVLSLRNLDDPSKYLSSEFALIAVDELTMNQKTVFDMLRLRLRWPGIEDVCFLGATNPGQIGHGWVKRLWMDRKFDENETEANQFFYVKALPKDNPFFTESYKRQLESMPDKMRRAYLEGDWTVFAGQYFTEFDESIHVCEPFEIPENWMRFISLDYGYHSNTDDKGYAAVYWHAVDPITGKVYTYREIFVREHTGEMLGSAIYSANNSEKIAWIVADNNIANVGKESGRSVMAQMREVFEENKFDCPIRLVHKGPHSRVNGWNLMRGYFKFDTDAQGKRKTRWQIFKCCENLIRTIPLQVYKDDTEDLDTDGPDDCVDSVRYGFTTLNEPFDKKPPEPKKEIKQRPMTPQELYDKAQAEWGDISYN